MINKEIVVSICVITYNHEPYIADTIEGVLMQKTNFPLELVIGEDCSTDRTREICIKYKEKYPGIKLNLPERNLGAIPNFILNLKACTGKYIALCEGDDYWTDPLKLQKQVDFLESNPDYSLCYHNALIKYEGVKGKDKLFCDNTHEGTMDIQNVIKGVGMPTASMLFRTEALEIPEWLKHIYNGDYALQLILANKGKVKYLDKIMSVYRIQPGGLNSTMKNAIIQQRIIELMNYFNIHTSFRYKDLVDHKTNMIFKDYPFQVLCGKTRLHRLFTALYWKRRLQKLF